MGMGSDSAAFPFPSTTTTSQRFCNPISHRRWGFPSLVLFPPLPFPEFNRLCILGETNCNAEPACLAVADFDDALAPRVVPLNTPHSAERKYREEAKCYLQVSLSQPSESWTNCRFWKEAPNYYCEKCICSTARGKKNFFSSEHHQMALWCY